MNTDRQKELGQYMTPAWAARELFEAHFSDMGMADCGLEPTCGDGRMLQAIPDHVPAFGFEIDPDLATKARARTGRQVIVGDVLTADLPHRFNFVFGNPPFKSDFMHRLLDRIHTRMEDGCRCGLIVPAYFMQSPSTVVRWNRVWTIHSELLPRTLFPRARLPLIFALFTKDPVPSFRGMRLFLEAYSMEDLNPEFREEMNSGRGLWRGVVFQALQRLGGRAHLKDIYHVVGRNRPTKNEWWREKVRQTLQRAGCFSAQGAGVWSIHEKAA
jgi:predicted RNA methylase